MKGDMAAAAVMVTGAAGLIGNAVRTKLTNHPDGLSYRSTLLVPPKKESRLSFVTWRHPPIARRRARPQSGGYHSLRGSFWANGRAGQSVFDGPGQHRRYREYLELARLLGARVVYCSSTSVYGSTPRAKPVPEDVALFPVSVYGASKVAGEQLVSTYASQFKVDGVSLSLSWVYGPRRKTSRVVRTMIVDALTGRPRAFHTARAFTANTFTLTTLPRLLLLAGSAKSAAAYLHRHRRVLSDIRRTRGHDGAHFPNAEIELGPGPDPDDGVSRLSIYRRPRATSASVPV